MAEPAIRHSSRQRGFTLIELMVVVVILGVLAAIALPAFGGYLKIAKTSEATGNLNNIFKSAAAFYTKEQTGKGMHGDSAEFCVVEPTGMDPPNPTNQKRKFTGTGGFKTLGFSIADLVYYGYGISSIATSSITCGIAPNTENLYTFYANGDIDGDTILSTFTLAAGSDNNGQLYHSRGFYADHPTE